MCNKIYFHNAGQDMELFNLASILLLTIITGTSVACNPHDDSQGHQDVDHVYVRVYSPEKAKSIISDIAARQAAVADGTPNYCAMRIEAPFKYKMLTKSCVLNNSSFDEEYLVFI